MKKSIKQKQSLCKSKGKVYNKQTGRCKDTITTKRSRCKSKGKVYDRSKGRCKVSVVTKRSRCRSKGQVYNKDNGRCKVSVATKRSRCKSKGKVYDVKSGKCKTMSKSKGKAKSRSKSKGKAKSRSKSKGKSRSKSKGKSRSKSKGKSRSKSKGKAKSKSRRKTAPKSPYNPEFKEFAEFWEKKDNGMFSYGLWLIDQLDDKHPLRKYFTYDKEIGRFPDLKAFAWQGPDIGRTALKDLPKELYLYSGTSGFGTILGRYFDQIKDNCLLVNELMAKFIEYKKNEQTFLLRTKRWDHANRMMIDLVLPFSKLTNSQYKKLLLWLHPDKCDGANKYKQNINLIQNARKMWSDEFKDKRHELDHNIIKDYGLKEIVPLLF